LAKQHDISPVTLAIAWSKQHDFVASTIIGARKVEQLDDSFASLDLILNDEILEEIKNIQADIMYPMG